MREDDLDASGEESVGGTAPTPDQDDVEELAIATGIEIDDRQPLKTTEMLDERDERRWELDQGSAEDDLDPS